VADDLKYSNYHSRALASKKDTTITDSVDAKTRNEDMLKEE